MSRVRALLGCLAAAALLPAGAAAAEGDRAARQREQSAIDLINRAARQTSRAECRGPSPGSLTTTLVEGGAGPQVAGALGVFRRPATQAERDALAEHDARGRLDNPFFATVGREGLRVVETADGTRVTLLAAQTTRRLSLAPAVYDRCQRRTRARLRTIATTATLRRLALRTFDELTERERPDPAAPPVEGLMTSVGGGGGGGPFSPRDLERTGGITLTGGNAKGSRVVAVLPDGVARVRVTYPRLASRGPYRDAKDYGRTETVEARVTENVASFRTARPAPDAFGARVVWFAPDGSVVRDIRPQAG